MEILLFILVFIFGSIIGSFLNVVILRLNTCKTIISGRSMCMSCGKNLRWFELIPIFSFLAQSGKCRRCKSKISFQYIIVEFITALVFSLIVFKFIPFSYFNLSFYLLNTVLYIGLFCLLIVISSYDLKHKIIPSGPLYSFIVLSFLSIFINQNMFGGLFSLPNMSMILAGPILSLPFFMIWLLSNERLMGLGDVKLILGIGFMLGLSEGIFAVVMSFWIGAVISLFILLLSKKRIKMKTQVPFAPFLALGVFITFFLNLNVFDLGKLFGF